MCCIGNRVDHCAHHRLRIVLRHDLSSTRRQCRTRKQVTLLSGIAITRLSSICRKVRNLSLFAQWLDHFLCLGTHVIWGLDLRDDNINAAYLETKALVQAFQSSAVKAAGITLDFFEIGNEANLYADNGGRKNSWGPTQYVTECVLGD